MSNSFVKLIFRAPSQSQAACGPRPTLTWEGFSGLHRTTFPCEKKKNTEEALISKGSPESVRRFESLQSSEKEENEPA